MAQTFNLYGFTFNTMIFFFSGGTHFAYVVEIP